MNIKFRDDGTFTILMKDYLKESIVEFAGKIIGSIISPAQNGLFMVDPESELLDQPIRKRFHSITAKLLYFPIEPEWILNW